MESSEVLKKELKGNYQGYLLQKIRSYGQREPIVWSFFRKLEKIPHKITYFFKRELILEVRKSPLTKRGEPENYLLLLTDGTYLEAVY